MIKTIAVRSKHQHMSDLIEETEKVCNSLEDVRIINVQYDLVSACDAYITYETNPQPDKNKVKTCGVVLGDNGHSYKMIMGE